MSIKPGATIHPGFRTSSRAAPSAGNDLPTRATRPSSTSTSNSPSRPFAGSTTLPPFTSNFMPLGPLHPARYRARHGFRLGLLAGKQIQHGHPDGDAVGDLL